MKMLCFRKKSSLENRELESLQGGRFQGFYPHCFRIQSAPGSEHKRAEDKLRSIGQ